MNCFQWILYLAFLSLLNISATTKTDNCLGVTCEANEECNDAGECICKQGFKEKNGDCVEDKCFGSKCGINGSCIESSGKCDCNFKFIEIEGVCVADGCFYCDGNNRVCKDNICGGCQKEFIKLNPKDEKCVLNMCPYCKLNNHICQNNTCGVCLEGFVEEVHGHNFCIKDTCQNVNCDGQENKKCDSRTGKCECYKDYVAKDDGCILAVCEYNQCKHDSKCEKNTESFSTNRKYKCVCGENYEGEFCECKKNVCEGYKECTNTSKCEGCTTPYCVCDNKEHIYQNGKCEELNPCTFNPCKSSQTCHKAGAGNYVCCNQNYEFDGNSCKEQDLCEKEKGCDINANCSMKDGRKICKCKDGYFGDGKTCKDIDECQRNPFICQQECINIQGSYNCTCRKGFKQNGTNCEIEDLTRECNDDCGNGICIKDGKENKCECNRGYLTKRNENKCSVIDDVLCEKACPEKSSCENGVTVCVCEDEFQFNEERQICIEHCKEYSCPQNSVCVNTEEEVQKCVCKFGFIQPENSEQCHGACVWTGNSICSKLGKLCVKADNEDSYTCVCRPSFYEQENGTCVPAKSLISGSLILEKLYSENMEFRNSKDFKEVEDAFVKAMKTAFPDLKGVYIYNISESQFRPTGNVKIFHVIYFAEQKKLSDLSNNLQNTVKLLTIHGEVVSEVGGLLFKSLDIKDFTDKACTEEVRSTNCINADCYEVIDGGYSCHCNSYYSNDYEIFSTADNRITFCEDANVYPVFDIKCGRKQFPKDGICEDFCTKDRCGKNGKCEVVNEENFRYTCRCDAGYSGDNCEMVDSRSQELSASQAKEKTMNITVGVLAAVLFVVLLIGGIAIYKLKKKNS